MDLFFNPEKIYPDEFLKIKDKVNVLDIRSDVEVSEFDSSEFPNYNQIPITELENRTYELDSSKTYYILCRSGQRSFMASEILNRHNIKSIVIFGGMDGIKKSEIK